VLGLSYAEATRHLSVPEGTVTTRLYRGRRLVTQTLTDDPEHATNPMKVAW
jgi:DNA-directed RNA polymerase specialized sigma24 family protein